MKAASILAVIALTAIAALLYVDPINLHAGAMLAVAAAVDPAAVKAELQRIGDSVKAMGEKAGARVEETIARLQTVEQRIDALTAGGSANSAAYLPDGSGLQAALEGAADVLANMNKGTKARAVFEVTGASLGAAPHAALTTTGVPTDVTRRPGFIAPPERRFGVRSLLPSIPLDNAAYQFIEETGFTNNAAPVSETVQKPESTFTYALRTATPTVIAHWIKASNQVLDDVASLLTFIDGRLRYGLKLKEDQQFLYGSGSGNNIHGMMLWATAYSRAEGGDTRIDTLRRSLTQLELVEFAPTGFVLNPVDWEAIELTKNTETGEYVVGQPRGGGLATLWNRPVIVTPAIAVGDWLTGDFEQAALILDRKAAVVELFREDADNVQKNMVTIRAEERLGLAKLRPLALVKGTF